MSKSMEVVIQSLEDRMDLGAKARRLMKAKRLTDAELAAELFRQTSWLGALGRTYATGEGRNILLEAAFTSGPITRDEHEWLTIKRFATLPHYDEGPAS